MKSTINFDKTFVGRLAAFWDTEQTYRGNSIYEPAAQASDEAIFPAEYTPEMAIAECREQSDCFGNHVCICRIDDEHGGITQIQRLDFETESNDN